MDSLPQRRPRWLPPTRHFWRFSAEAMMYGRILWMVVSGFIFIYLGYVLIKPEKF